MLRLLFGATFTSAVNELIACIGQECGRFDPHQVDLPRLRSFAASYSLRGFGDDVEAFLQLSRRNFAFYFTSGLPNLSDWQSEAVSAVPGRVALSAQILAVPDFTVACSKGHSVESFYFEAASDREYGDRFSRGLASVMRLDPWDFNQHVVRSTPTAHELQALLHTIEPAEDLAWK